jgi:anti-anti-sigma regulatory factor/HAMP domain-containing protein
MVAFLVVAIVSAGAATAVAFNSASAGLMDSFGGQLSEHARSNALDTSAMLEREVISLRTLAIGEGLQRAISIANSGYTDRSAGAVRARLGEREQAWRAAADTDSLVEQALASPIAEDLREYQQSNPDDVELLITDRFGGLVAASRRISKYDQSGEEWWQRAWDGGRGKNYISQPIAGQEPTIMIVEPIYGHLSSDAIGVIRTTYRLSSLIARVRAIRVGATGQAHLLAGSRMVGEAAELDPNSQTQVEAAAALPFAQIDFQGERRFVSLAPVAGLPEVAALGWQLMLQQDEDDALAPVTGALQKTLIAIIGLLLLVLALAIGLAQLISAPIKRVTDAARRIAAGDLSQRLGRASADEIGQLAQSFDSMAESLEARIASEQQAQAERLQLQEQVILSQAAHLQELSTPLIPLTSTVLLLPLIGAIDSRRAELIFETLLRGVAERRARTVILDLTGVPIIDTQVAQALLRAAQGVRLMGAAAMLAGIRAEVAQTLVVLGADLSNLPVYANLQTAITEVTSASAVQTL